MARRDRRRAELGALAVSVLVHLVLFVILAREAVPSLRLPATAQRDVQLQLIAAPPPPVRERPLVSPPPRASARPARRVQPVPRPAPARPLPAPPRTIGPRPAAPRTPSAPPAPASSRVTGPPAGGPSGGAGGRAQGSGRWTVQGDDGQDGVRKFLRATVGCAHDDYVRLNADERADCDRRVGEEARRFADKQLMDPDQRAAFIAAAEAQERTRASRTGPLQDVLGPCQGNSNLGGGCLKDPSRHPNGGP